MPGGSERPGMPEAEGMTMHVTEYADGEEMYSYDYAMLGQKYCIDRIGGILIISRKRETWNLKVKRITSRNSAAPH